MANPSKRIQRARATTYSQSGTALQRTALLKRSMNFRFATLHDSHLLAELNHQLIRDEGHRNRMTVPELEERMHAWLSGEYRAVLMEKPDAVIAYALFCEHEEEIYLRQLFVVREHRRCGIGRAVVELLRSQVWPKHKRLTVSVLVNNLGAVAFWRAVGYHDYCLTLEIVPKHAAEDGTHPAS